MTELSVLIATRNGGDILRRTLQGYVDLGDQDMQWELIIVDNNSDDEETPKIIREFQAKLPLTALHQPKPGKNCALNLGLASITSGRVILSDDDAIPHDGFLKAWIEAFDRHPDAAVFGATVVPSFDEPIPEWMSDHKPKFEELYARREGVSEGAIGPDEIYGPNMAVRRKVFDEGLKFAEDIGPSFNKKNYAMGSETEFCQRAHTAGYKLVFVRGPAVSHLVRHHQTQPEFIAGRSYRLGKGSALKHWKSGLLKRRGHSPARAVASAIKHQLKLLSLRMKKLSPDPLVRFCANWDTQFLHGYRDEVLDLRREHSHPPQKGA